MGNTVSHALDLGHNSSKIYYETSIILILNYRTQHYFGSKTVILF